MYVIAESLCYTVGKNTVLYVDYTLIINKINQWTVANIIK